MGMIWDHPIVWNNYGNQVPIGTPYQLLKHTCFTCSMEMIWDHPVTQENCGSKLPIAIPYQQLIHNLLYLLYGNDMGSFNGYPGNCVQQCKRSKKGKNRQASVSEGFLNTDIQWGYF